MTAKGERPKAARARRGVTMPEDYRRLMEEGGLFPKPGDPRAMKCARCGGLVALIRNGPPPAKGEPLGAGVWGEEVTVVCPCCSFEHCTHKGKRNAEERTAEKDAVRGGGRPAVGPPRGGRRRR